MEAPKELFQNIIEEFIPFHKVIGFKLINVRGVYSVTRVKAGV